MNEQIVPRRRFRFQAGLLSLLLLIAVVAVWLAKYQANSELESIKVEAEEAEQLSKKFDVFLENVKVSIEATP